MKKILCVLILAAFIGRSFSQGVKLVYSKSSPQASYAAGRLQKTLAKKGYQLNSAKADFTINIKNDAQLGAEAYSVATNGKNITVTGGDGTGMIYGSLSIAEDLGNGVALKNIKASEDKPHMALRAVKFDMPWDTYRHSFALDQHYATCRDINYWKAFLDMMVENRLNALSLWDLHPFSFMIRAKNFPKATPYNDKELKEWQDLFHGIFRLAKERGIDTYLVPFNIFFSPEFAKNYPVQRPNLDHDFFVDGDTTEIVKRYTRESVTQVLQEYPELTGIGFTLGEGMGGFTSQGREDWMRDVYIEGMRLAGRPVKLIHRIPFSSTTGSLGVTSIETEKLTRKAIEEEAQLPFIEGPIWADLKYNWSHAASTTKLIKVHGGKLYDTYFKPLPTTYKVTWTARNEDFFCLRWGVPEFVREHVEVNSQPYTGGYFIGSETYIPAKDYFTKPGIKVNWKYAFERQWLYYKLWGRLLYNPKTSDEVFNAEFIRRYGAAGKNLLEASSLAGKTPLRIASSFDFTSDLTLYTEGMMAQLGKDKTLKYIGVDDQIKRPVLDADAYVSITDYVKKTVAGDTFDPKLITPPILADLLERDCNKALDLVKNINTTTNTALMFEVADIKTWSNLGLNLAEKLRGGVALQTYRLKGGEENKDAAVKHLEKALDYWKKVAAITRPIYNDMPLTHMMDQGGKSWKDNYYDKFHWALITPQVAADIEIAKNAKTGK
ncbi:MAG TPA: glycoside hydrolase family 20 zincin-like fold domain-containing protein [Mucilaginibacter sp.]